MIVLVCGYLLSDQPDRLSVMHFDPNPACPTVIGNAHHGTYDPCEASVSSQSPVSRKTNITRHISFDIMMPIISGNHFEAAAPVIYSYALPDHYDHLFYKEINPPPPRC